MGASEGVGCGGHSAVAHSVRNAVSNTVGSLETHFGTATGAGGQGLVSQTAFGSGSDTRSRIGQIEVGFTTGTGVVGCIVGAVADYSRENASIVDEVARWVAEGASGVISVCCTSDNTIREGNTSASISIIAGVAASITFI